ncbi:hypothetical protein [Porphyrobacter sp. YT40]|uniref:hypothetical protein n=1 Tax=Porphyrobacter sp. YT40 TaxID=2547601 RepID=UPI001144F7B8|nr:hypothetical protein [Porphyrobacter sp. YT40]QDH33983.1 hypothetical protein E2E27_06325 [Porphyrobacter sp. YT40]
MNPIPWLRQLTPIWKAILGVVLLIALIWAFLFVRDLFTGSARTEAKLATGQADAALKSGQDTATTVGEQAETEAERERSVADMQKDVNDADDASGAHDSGAGWLCDNFGICS